MLTTVQSVAAVSDIGEKSGLLKATLDQQQMSAADLSSISQFNNTLFDTIKESFGGLVNSTNHGSLVASGIEFSKNPSGLNALKLQTQEGIYAQSSILISKLVGIVIKDIDALVRIQ